MNAILVYHYANCSSCREAINWLRKQDIPFVTRDLFGDPLSAMEIANLCQTSSVTASALLSVRSRPYRELALAGKSLTGEETFDLMAVYPALIRRPLLVDNGQIVIGLDRAGIEALASQAAQKVGHYGT